MIFNHFYRQNLTKKVFILGKKSQIRSILEGMSSNLKSELNQKKDIHYNPNVKGHDYEIAVKDFLDSHLSGKFHFFDRVFLLDTNLEIFDIFSPSENEWDVVACHKNIVPHPLLTTGESSIIPYDAVAFLVSVKQNFVKKDFLKDCERFKRLSSLGYYDKALSIGGDFTLNRPLKCVLYFSGDIKEKTFLFSRDEWDIITIVDNDIFVANKTLPLSTKLTGGIFFRNQYALPLMLLFIVASISTPLGKNTCNLIFNMLKQSLD